ncbi:MAG: trehalose-6-phosphate synthase, partial [Calothrix sp. SM1_5_4]|nr:trehalose-6-phosphate synthase [Calothrix sp. SM1_5_4]
MGGEGISDVRSKLVAGTLQETLESASDGNSWTRAGKIFQQVVRDERLYALAFCDGSGKLRLQTSPLPAEIGCGIAVPGVNESSVVQLGRGALHVSRYGILPDGGDLLVVHDMSFVDRRAR